MNQVLLLVLSLAVSMAIRAPNEDITFDLNPPENEEPSVFSDGMMNLVSQVVATTVTVPLGGQLFVVLICTFVILSIVMYVLNQYKFFKGKFYPDSNDGSDVEKQNAEKSTLELVFNEATLSNARNAMSFTPVVCTLMLFLLFRALAQNYDTHSSKYMILEAAMVVATIGILLQTLDAFSVRVYSEIFGNMSESLGTLCVYFGLVVFIWALFTVQLTELPMSLPNKLVIILVFLFIGTMLLLKVMELKKRYFDSRSPIALQGLNDLLSDARIEEVRQTALMSPFLLLVLVYVNFRYLQTGSLPQYIEIGLIGAVSSIGAQGIVVLLKPLMNDYAGKALRFLAIISTTTFFLIAMITIVINDWPGASIAMMHVLLLLFVIALLMVEITLLQEVAQHVLVNPDDETSKQRFAQLTAVSQGMMSTTAFAHVVILMLLYLHYNAEFLLKAPDVDQYIKNQRGLKEFIYFVSVSIFTQLGAQLLEALTGPGSALTVITSAAILIMNVGLAGIIYYVVA